MRKINNFLIFFIIFIPILLFFIIATYYDFEITSFFASLNLGDYYSNNFFAIFFEVTGETVLYILTALSLAVLFWNTEYYIKGFKKYLFEFILYLIISFVCFLWIWRAYNFIGNYSNISITVLNLIIFIVVAFIFGFLLIYSLKKVKKTDIKKLFWFACLIILVAVFSNLAVQLFKDFFGRMRFRAMNSIADFSYFTPWYVPNGKVLANSLSIFNLPTEAFRSFPSGHTTATALSFCFWFFPVFFKKLNGKTKFWCFFLPVAVTVLVGIARMVAGAHFLTDVIFGILFVFLFISIFAPYLLYLKKQKWHNLRKKNI